jgi:hypothetical protein
MKTAIRKCEQNCEQEAEVYAMGPFAGDWAGWYCEPCAKALGFRITDRIKKENK